MWVTQRDLRILLSAIGTTEGLQVAEQRDSSPSYVTLPGEALNVESFTWPFAR